MRFMTIRCKRSLRSQELGYYETQTLLMVAAKSHQAPEVLRALLFSERRRAPKGAQRHLLHLRGALGGPRAGALEG